VARPSRVGPCPSAIRTAGFDKAGGLLYSAAVNRRRALFKLAALPGALAATAWSLSARAQPTFDLPVPMLPPPPAAGPTTLIMSPDLGSTESMPVFPGAARKAMDELLFKALSLVGTRYRSGGMSPETGFDCSGYVSYLFNEVFAMRLPRTSDGIGQRGAHIPRNALQPGDLVFFNTMRRPFTHVGIYLGDDRFIHAPATGGLVRTESLNERYWVKRWDGARRILPNS